MSVTDLFMEVDAGSILRELAAIGELRGLAPVRPADGSVLVARYLSVLQKLGARNRTRLVVLGIRRGQVDY
jgi:hypothetical protein